MLLYFLRFDELHKAANDFLPEKDKEESKKNISLTWTSEWQSYIKNPFPDGMSSPTSSAAARDSLNAPIELSECNEAIDLNEEMTALATVLTDDLNACDMKWTFFVAAANSYRYDSQLKPYPVNPADGKPYDIEHLHAIVAKVPPFSALLERLQAKQPLADEIVHLLHWILVRVRDPYLKSVDRSNVSTTSSSHQLLIIVGFCFFCFVVQFDMRNVILI